MTIKDIARLSGYAVGTVSRVLNGSPNVSDEARAKILAVVEEHHFKLNNNAKHLKQQVSTGIAIIVKGSQNMLFASIVERMQGLIKQNGLACLIYYIDEDDSEVDQALQVCQERRPLGLLFLGSTLEAFGERFSTITIPCVLVTNSAEGVGFDNLSSVSTDDTAAAEMAVEHLIRLGHRNIGVLGGKTEISRAAYARYRGCRRVFDRHSIPFDRQRQLVEERFAISSGYRAMEELLISAPETTAVFAMADVMAVGAIRAIRDHNLRVPEDISVIGFDGIDLGEFLTPRLATIRQHRERIADRSVEILLAQIEQPGPAIHELVPFDLVEGESVLSIHSPEGA